MERKFEYVTWVFINDMVEIYQWEQVQLFFNYCEHLLEFLVEKIDDVKMSSRSVLERLDECLRHLAGAPSLLFHLPAYLSAR